MPTPGEEAMEGPQLLVELPTRNHGRLPEGGSTGGGLCLSQRPEATLKNNHDNNSCQY